MNRKSRTAILAAGIVAALALSAPALATYSPRIAISHNTVATSGTHPTTIHVSIPQTDDPTAAVNIFVPAGYQIQTATPGATIGSATASVLARDTGLTLPLEGPVTADDPARHATDVCSPGNNMAVWLLALSVAGQMVTVPLYINPTAGTSAALGSFVIKVCLPPPDVPQGTPGRAVLGAQLLDTRFTVNTTTLPSGADTHAWRALFTPYTPGRGTPNVAGTVEARSFVGVPGAASLRARYVKKTNTYRLSGRVTEGGTAVASQQVQIFRGRSVRGLRRVANATTNASGNFAASGKLRPRKTTYFQARTTVDERDYAAGCSVTDLPPTGVPCSSATRGGFAAFSSIIRIRV
jgi:hypothetical protein